MDKSLSQITFEFFGQQQEEEINHILPQQQTTNLQQANLPPQQKPKPTRGRKALKDFEADAGPIGKVDGEGNLIAHVKQNQMLHFLGHKTVKEWLLKHTDTSITRQHARSVQQWAPRSRLSTLPSLSVTSINSDNSRAILIIDADLVDV